MWHCVCWFFTISLSLCFTLHGCATSLRSQTWQLMRESFYPNFSCSVCHRSMSRHTHTHACTHTHTCTHARMHTYIHTHSPTQSQQHMHMCTCMCTHTHTHTHKSDEVCLDSFNPASAAPRIIRVASPQAHWLPPEYSGFPSTRHYH